MAKKERATTSLGAGGMTVQQITDQANKQFGIGTLMSFAGGALQNVPSVSTGSLSLDDAIGIGGLPYGRIVEVYGPESSGKTTLCIETLVNVQRDGKHVAFIDTEHALDPQYAESLGLNMSELMIAQPDSGEEACDLLEMLVRTGSVGAVVIDSVANLTPAAELAGKSGESHMGVQARLMSQTMRKITGVAKKTGCLVIFTNQIRSKIGTYYGSNETTTGGNALKFYASVRLDIRRKEAITDNGNKEGEVIGNIVGIKVVKNKMAPPFKKCETRIMYGTGFDYYYDVFQMALKYGAIQKAGSWYKFNDESIGQGADSVIEMLRDNSTFCDSVIEYVNADETEAEVIDYEAEIIRLRALKKETEKGTKEYKAIMKELNAIKKAMEDNG